jgi:autotransporter-associated beta strand protein
MCRIAHRLGYLLAAFLATAAPAAAQITWNVTYADGVIGTSGTGFADPTVAGTTTLGQLRRDSITAATVYLNTVLDGRGTVNLSFDQSLLSGSGFIAEFGPHQLTAPPGGSFQNGGAYQAARSNQRPFTGPDGSGRFNFGYGWNYAGQTPSAGNFDMTTVAIHEISHSLGFLSFVESNGMGLGSRTVGTPDAYSTFDKYLQRGNGPGGTLLNGDITNTGFGSFLGPVDTLRNNNNATTGLFFGGQYTREVRNGPAPLFAPSNYQPGTSTSHVNDPSAVMNPNTLPNTVKRFLNYEIAMLLDIGWNVYNWNGSDGSWGDGIDDVAQSRWRTDQGIIYNGNQQFNTFTNPGEAPILPVYGQATSNIVLNFRGSGAASYTATDNIGTVRLARLNLNSTSTATNTITGGTLLFGVNNDNDGTASILTPKIVQQNTGAFVVNSNTVITNTTAAPGGGWTGLTVDGTGTGKVTLGGVISGTGTLTKAGAFTLELNGPAANTYTGTTTVSGGVLLLNKTGVNAIAGNVTLNTGGMLRLGATNQIADTAAVRLSGGTFSTGETAGSGDVVGALELTADSTIAFGTGDHVLRFAGITGTPTGVLTITGWSGASGEFGGGGRLQFAGIGDTPNTTYANFLSTTHFQGFGSGAKFLATAEPGVVELVPAPEPATVLAFASAALGLGTLARRRWGKATPEVSRLFP